MSKPITETVTCPHCEKECQREALTNINIDKNPEMREKVQKLDCFRWTCPNCGITSLLVDPCLYHDMTNQFMVWLSPEGKPQDVPRFDPLAGYTLRWVTDLNGFREKINILERGLDDRAVEVMKLLLYLQVKADLDVVEILFHDYQAEKSEFRFAAVLSDGVEQYIAMPGAVYARLADDIETLLYSPHNTFVQINLDWAAETLEMLRASAD